MPKYKKDADIPLPALKKGETGPPSMPRIPDAVQQNREDMEPPAMPTPGSGGTAYNVAKGGPITRRYNKGGSVEHSTEDAFKANLVETLANPTGKTKFAKGGAVAKSNPPTGHGWRRWGHGK